MADTDWSDEDAALVRDLYCNAHMTASQIALRLSTRRTRNSVIGKIFRMRLKRPGSVNAEHRVTNVERRRPVARKKERPLPRVRVVVFHPKPEPEPEPQGIPFLELRSHQCKWPYGEGTGITFCGHNRNDGFPYCEAHCRLSYTTWPGRPGNVTGSEIEVEASQTADEKIIAVEPFVGLVQLTEVANGQENETEPDLAGPDIGQERTFSGMVQGQSG